MADGGVTAVLLPLAAWFLREPAAQARPFLNAGVTVALGSNINPGTQPIESVSMLLAAGCLLSGLAPAQALWACTAGGAQALRLSDRGALRPGLRADLVLFSCTGAEHLPYHAGVEHAQVVIRGGKIVQRVATPISPTLMPQPGASSYPRTPIAGLRRSASTLPCSRTLRPGFRCSFLGRPARRTARRPGGF